MIIDGLTNDLVTGAIDLITKHRDGESINTDHIHSFVQSLSRTSVNDNDEFTPDLSLLRHQGRRAEHSYQSKRLV